MKYVKAKEIEGGLYKVIVGDVKFNIEKDYVSVGFKLNQDTTTTKYYSTAPDKYSDEAKIWKNMEDLYKVLGFVWNAALTDIRDVAVALETLVNKTGPIVCLLLRDEYNGNAYVKPYSLKSEAWLMDKFQRVVVPFNPGSVVTVPPVTTKTEFFNENEGLPF